MVATFWLLGWVLTPAQTPQRPMPSSPPSAVRTADVVLTPRLVRGQELVYRGSYTEESVGTSVQFQRAYRLENRFFVLETPPRGADLAVLTLLHSKSPRPAARGIVKDPPPSSVRLERLQLGLQGQLTAAEDVSLSVPLDGAPTLEVGAFVELPRSRLALSGGWESTEPERPVQRWRMAGTDSINGQSCVKIVGVQQSDDWDRPRADRAAWRRQDTVWIMPRSGIAQRVERIIEQREPARREVSQRSTARYELESSLQYPTQLVVDRRQEITQAFAFREAAQPLLGEPLRHARALQTIVRRIATHLENQPPTPYREAIHLVRRQVEAASKGEVVTVLHKETASRAVTVANIGDQAPDFVAGPLSSKESGKLSKWNGKPVLLIFYHPASYTAPDLLRFAQKLHVLHGRQMTVVGLSVIDDVAQVTKQREALKVDIPVYSGGGIRISYGVESTPKLVVIDSTGVIRGMYLGWGSETSREVMAELNRWLPGR
jgi:peroxiredoxin